ncbi:hypothetical protein HGM15179_019863, partial [Zosterops borbonicus]
LGRAQRRFEAPKSAKSLLVPRGEGGKRLLHFRAPKKPQNSPPSFAFPSPGAPGGFFPFPGAGKKPRKCGFFWGFPREERRGGRGGRGGGKAAKSAKRAGKTTRSGNQEGKKQNQRGGGGKTKREKAPKERQRQFRLR